VRSLQHLCSGSVPDLLVTRGGVAQTLRPGTVRPIEYEIVSKTQLATAGPTHDAVAREMGGMSELALVRCVDDRGAKLTAIADPVHMRRLLRSGEAGNPDGMILTKRYFPVIAHGWLRAEESLVPAEG
jgi:hypothetical protein